MQQEHSSAPLSTNHLFCSNKNLAKLLCCSQKCESCALVCRRQQCNCLPQNHNRCQFVYTESLIKEVSSKRKQIDEETQRAIQKIDKVYEEAIEKLSIDRQALTQWKNNYGLSLDQANFLEYIQTNQLEGLTGSFIYKIRQNIQSEISHPWLTQKWVNDFWEGGKTQFDRIFYRIDQLVTSNSQLKKKTMRKDGKVFYELDLETVSGKCYSYHAQTSTVKKTTGNGYQQIVSQDPLPKVGKCYFQLRVNQATNGSMGIGVVTESHRTRDQVWNSKNSVKLFCHGNLWKNDQSQFFAEITNGTVVRVSIDFDQKTIQWSSEDRLFAKTNFNDEIVRRDLYVSVQVMNTGDSFTVM